MKKVTKFGVAAVCLVFGLLVVVAMVAFGPKAKPREQTPPEALLVSVVNALPASHIINIHAEGTLEPKARVNIAAQATGVVTALNPEFEVGKTVHKGDELAVLDDREYRYQLTRAEAQLAKAQEALAKEQGAAIQAKKEWRDLGNAQANELFLRKPQISAAVAAVSAAEADVAQAQLNVARTKITAPFSGVISERRIELGQLVNNGFIVAELIDTQAAKVALKLTHKQRALLAINTTPNVKLSSDLWGAKQEWRGHITRIAPDVDSNNRLYTVFADISAEHNPPFNFGTFVNAEIMGSPIANVLKLPRSALYQGQWLYSVNAKNQIEIEAVTVLQSNREFVWLEAMAKKDGPYTNPTQYIVRDQGLMQAGMLVRVAEADNE